MSSTPIIYTLTDFDDKLTLSDSDCPVNSYVLHDDIGLTIPTANTESMFDITTLNEITFITSSVGTTTKYIKAMTKGLVEEAIEVNYSVCSITSLLKDSTTTFETILPLNAGTADIYPID